MRAPCQRHDRRRVNPSAGFRRATVFTLITPLLLACDSSPDGSALSGTWRLDTARSSYAGSAEARVEETFTCTARGDALDCAILGVKADGDTSAARFTIRDRECGPVEGVAGVDCVTLRREDDAFHAVFTAGSRPVLGYRITTAGDSMIIETTDPATRRALGTRIVYTRER